MKLAKYTVEIECPDDWADGQGVRVDLAVDALDEIYIEDSIEAVVKNAVETRTALAGVTVKVIA